jgi:superfamily II DNA or RNA helicase
LFLEGSPPKNPVGVTFGLYQTLLGYLPSVEPGQYDLVIVDEAHHALANGFLKCIEHLKPRFLLGMTATPWRGDGDSIDRIFGKPIAKMSLVDGMAMGFLAEVDYRILSDNIKWDEIPRLSKNRLTIRDLNRQLFIPQRDEAATSKIFTTFKALESPKLIVFSPSIDHAEYIAKLLSASGVPTRNISGLDRFTRQKFLMEFAAGRLKALSAVDVLNEGIDVPDVNMLAFMRATHSRRIFVQQLGRGLRLSPGKRKVVVLDFVSDIRRLAEVAQMDHEARAAKLAPEALYLREGFVRFDNERTGTFVEEWLKDVADLCDENDAFELTFPAIP